MADNFYVTPNGRLMRDVQGGGGSGGRAVQYDVKALDMTPLEMTSALTGVYGPSVKALVQEAQASQGAYLGTFVPHAKRKMAAGRIFTGLTTATAGTAAGSTWHLSAAAGVVPFTHIAPIFQSLETGPITVTSTCVGAIDGLGSSGLPGSLPHSGITYYPGSFGGAASGVIPPRIGPEAPSLLIGDFTPCRALNPNNLGIYWLAIRAYFAGTGYSYRAAQNISGVAGSAGAIEGHGWNQINQNVDGVSVPANFTTNTAQVNQVITGFLTLTDMGGTVGLVTGDSTVAGVGTTSGCISGEVLAVYQLANAGIPMSIMNCGIPGAEPDKYGNFARNAVAQLGRYLSWAAYRVSSINEQCNTAARLEAHWAEAMRFVEACQSAGITAILETCTPQNLGSVANDVFRKALNDRVRAGRDWLVVDVDLAVSDPANPWQYLPAYNSGDNSHPSLAGYQAIAAAAKPVFATA